MNNWSNGEEYGAYGCPAYGQLSTSATGEHTGRIQFHASEYQTPQQQQLPTQQHHHQLEPSWNGSEAGCAEIPLLNDDHEKAILSDLCDQTVGESTPLSTFSYISEYICSNNIDIWPGESSVVGSACGINAPMSCSLDPKQGDQRSPTSTSCVHQQLFFRCKRVLESIIVRNEQILELLRQRQHQQSSCRQSRQ